MKKIIGKMRTILTLSARRGYVLATSMDTMAMPIVTLVRPAALAKLLTMTSVIAPPVGLAYIAGALRAAGHAVKVIDSVGEAPEQFTPLSYGDGLSIGLTVQEAVDAIPPQTDIVGFSCMFSNGWPFDHRLISAVRQRFPDALIVAGGEHVTACADYIMAACPAVDICVVGEGEHTMVEVVNNFRQSADIAQVEGIVCRSDGQVVTTKRRSRIRALDDIPLPAWDIMPIGNYMDRGLGHGITNQRSMPLLASRGCPYQCTFCSSPQMWTTRWVARTPKLVVDEMEMYIRAYNAENFDLYDLTAIIKKDWILAFAQEIIRRGLNIQYELPSGTRSEAIDRDVVEALRKSGCRQMNYAPETGSPERLLAIKKKVKIPRLLDSLENAVNGGLRIMLNMIVFPDDSWKDMALFAIRIDLV